MVGKCYSQENEDKRRESNVMLTSRAYFIIII
jgi:hypothetical protein